MKEEALLSVAGAGGRTVLKKRLVLNAILLLDVVVIAAAASLAWFANNTKTSGEGMSITGAPFRNYELASAGEKGHFSSGEYASTVGFQKTTGVASSVGPVTVYATSSAEPDVEWMVSEGSHIQNMLISSGYENQNKLQPGSSGKLSFYVLPPEDAPESAEISLELNLIPYQENSVTHRYEPLPANSPCATLLKGHILFFEDYSLSETGSYSGWIHDGSFTVNVSNEPTELSIYWIWPLYYTNLSGQRSPICEDGADRAAIISDMNANPGKYFSFSGSMDLGGFTLGGYDDNFHSNNYNRADEMIGTNVRYVLAEIAIQ